ncbi:sugar phosphorylase [Atlantibacter hermannii]|uniref:sugar phosphorylase n=1 Tax=Atlantibacter hermannii TaxID=565 RepID=UPI0028B0E4EA|nr:sugar phosphorylase [Atlantibacter hermannii]MCQ4969044.1 sugar phosphorylase [Enterobacteriaceae bacterium DFI.7.85]
MDKIINLISRVYSDEVDGSYIEKVKQRINACRKNIIETRKKQWNEADVVLITYADQFSSPNEKTLVTFKRFYDKYLAGIFPIVHFLPFYPWSSDDGFSVKDYHQVEPLYGDWKDIGQIKKSSRLMFDFVCNHISAQSEWFQGYLKGRPEYEDFFISVDPDTDLSAVTRPRALPLLTPFTLANGEVKHIWTTFSADQIDLNFANPCVLLAMVDVLLDYLEKGADYIRLDAVGFMWKTPGTSCIHLEKTHLLVKLFRAITDFVAPGTVIITETNVPHKDNVSYLGNGHDEAHMVYQFPLPPLVLHAIRTQSVSTLCRWASILPNKGDGQTTWFNFLASHDGIGLNPLRGIISETEIVDLVASLEKEGAKVNWKNNPDGTRSPYELNVTYMDALTPPLCSDDERLARFILAHALLLTFPGVPAVYIQSVLGSRNDYDGVARLGYNRAINRQKYSLQETERLLADPQHLRSRTLHSLTQLITVRQHHSAFHPDSEFSINEISDGVLEIIRGSSQDEQITALFNFTDKTKTLSFERNHYYDVISGESINSGTIILRPWQSLWLTNN